MDFISNKEEQRKILCNALGIEKIEELFAALPKEIQLPPPQTDDGLSEWEGMELMRSLAQENQAQNYACYLGAGAYQHHVPAIVSSITSKGEFLTSYTPYQAEASQGLLQVIFEFQSAVCSLTGLDVANASVYDGAAACAEALLLALRVNKGRTKVLVSTSLHPHYRAVIKQYLEIAEIIEIPCENGGISVAVVESYLDESVAALLLPYPSFFGTIDFVKECFSAAKKVGALSIACANPLVWALYESAPEIGADVAVGDLQPFGLPLSFGGPYAGYMACKESILRHLPGRLVGETVDDRGRRGFVLTLQAREQHIRREKATSNICSNQNLAVLASLITMLWYGPNGLKELALANYQRAAYLKKKLLGLPGVTSLNDHPFLHEFVIRFPIPVEKVLRHLKSHKILGGFSLEMYYPDLSDALLIAVTETKTREQLDFYVEKVKEIL